jgi:hypothetical protein
MGSSTSSSERGEEEEGATAESLLMRELLENLEKKEEYCKIQGSLRYTHTGYALLVVQSTQAENDSKAENCVSFTEKGRL